MPAVLVHEGVHPEIASPSSLLYRPTVGRTFAKLVQRADDSGGGISSGALAGIIIGVIGSLILIALLVFCARRGPTLRGPVFPAPSAPYVKSHSLQLPPQEAYLPRYTAPAQPVFIHHGVNHSPPPTFPIQINPTYYHKPQAQGVRFGEVGVRRIP